MGESEEPEGMGTAACKANEHAEIVAGRRYFAWARIWRLHLY